MKRRRVLESAGAAILASGTATANNNSSIDIFRSGSKIGTASHNSRIRIEYGETKSGTLTEVHDESFVEWFITSTDARESVSISAQLDNDTTPVIGVADLEANRWVSDGYVHSENISLSVPSTDRLVFVLAANGVDYNTVSYEFSLGAGSSGGSENGDLRSLSYGQTKSSFVDSDDPIVYQSYYYEPITFSGNEGDQIRVEVTSEDFTPFVDLDNPDGSFVTAGYGEIETTLETDGKHTIRVIATPASETGSYTISLSESTSDPISTIEDIRGNQIKVGTARVYNKQNGNLINRYPGLDGSIPPEVNYSSNELIVIRHQDWFNVIYEGNTLPNTITLNKQVLTQDTITDKDGEFNYVEGEELAVITLWRTVNPDNPKEQVFNIEAVDAADQRGKKPWEITGDYLDGGQGLEEGVLEVMYPRRKAMVDFSVGNNIVSNSLANKTRILTRPLYSGEATNPSQEIWHPARRWTPIYPFPTTSPNGQEFTSGDIETSRSDLYKLANIGVGELIGTSLSINKALGILLDFSEDYTFEEKKTKLSERDMNPNYTDRVKSSFGKTNGKWNAAVIQQTPIEINPGVDNVNVVARANIRNNKGGTDVSYRYQNETQLWPIESV